MVASGRRAKSDEVMQRENFLAQVLGPGDTPPAPLTLPSPPLGLCHHGLFSVLQLFFPASGPLHMLLLPDSFSLITLDLGPHPPSLSQPLACSFQNTSHMLISVIGAFTPVCAKHRHPFHRVHCLSQQ